MGERPESGLLDTSAVIDLGVLDPGALPRELSISAITLAELSAGPAAAKTPAERARRQRRLQSVEALFDPLPFGVEAARAYGEVAAAVLDAGRQPRGRIVDLLVAATALVEGLPLVTRNPDDFAGLECLIIVVAV